MLRGFASVPVVACVVASCIAWGLVCPLPARGAETDVIRGTVDRFQPGMLILSLTDVKSPDPGDSGKSVMVIVNKDTQYFDGLNRTTKESIAKGHLVLVKCKPAGTGRQAILVRIIGGKSR